jgi:hypothetical protein
VVRFVSEVITRTRERVKGGVTTDVFLKPAAVVQWRDLARGGHVEEGCEGGGSGGTVKAVGTWRSVAALKRWRQA